jgi:hypothetical protein
MLTKTLAWGVILICVGSGVWWLVDPQGFAQNPVFASLKHLSLRSSGYYR